VDTTWWGFSAPEHADNMKDDSWIKLRGYYNKAKSLADDEITWVWFNFLFGSFHSLCLAVSPSLSAKVIAYEVVPSWLKA